MENKIYISSLLDFYGVLLTEKQQEICRYYYDEDLSLQEIAEIVHTSRSAVYDSIHRCRDELNGYEEKLHLYAQYKEREKLYRKIREKGSEEVRALIDQCMKIENS